MDWKVKNGKNVIMDQLTPLQRVVGPLMALATTGQDLELYLQNKCEVA